MKCHLSVITAVTLTLTGAVACSSSDASHSANTMSTSPQATANGDHAWLAAAHQANLAEIQVGELAKKKGGTAAVRAAGAMLVTDHTASDTKVTRVAKELKVALPASVAPGDADAASRLSNETGPAFDHDFLATMRTGHQKVIALTRTEIAQGTVPQIKSLAQSTLPVLRKHLEELRKASAGG